MKARKILLAPYMVDLGTAGPGEPVPFDVKENLVAILYNRGLNLGPTELLEQHILAERIFKHEEDEILLSEEEYRRVRKALDACKGLSLPHVEFVKRVFNAVEVSVEEKKE